MLVSTVLVLEARNDAEIPLTHGDLAHAAFLDLIQKESESLAWRLHQANRHKPFTVSHLTGTREAEGKNLLIEREENYRWRLTALEKPLAELLLSLKGKTGTAIKIGGAEFVLEDVLTTPEEHRWARVTDYPGLVSGGEAETKIPFRFVSPTSFRVEEQNFLFPLPHLVFFSLAEKWQLYAPAPFSAEIKNFLDEMTAWTQRAENVSPGEVWTLLDKVVNVSGYTLKTQILDFRNYRRIGFTGFTEFQMQPPVPETWRRLLNVLADFAFYAGVGLQTTMGMGQTVRIKKEIKEEETE